jgi:hypothetical protein
VLLKCDHWFVTQPPTKTTMPITATLINPSNIEYSIIAVALSSRCSLIRAFRFLSHHDPPASNARLRVAKMTAAEMTFAKELWQRATQVRPLVCDPTTHKDHHAYYRHTD